MSSDGYDETGYEAHSLTEYAANIGRTKEQLLVDIVEINVAASEVAPEAPVPFIRVGDQIFVSKSFVTALREHLKN